METMTLFITALFIFIYFLPTIIAGNRWSINSWTILFLNLLLWWTGIIWLVCLILAFGKTHKEVKRDEEMLKAMLNLKNN